MATLSIFIGSVLMPACGQWVDLPQSEDDLAEIIEEVRREADCEEVMISDYEGDWDISEYDNIFELNERVREHGDSMEEAIDRIQDGKYCTYCECYSMADVAREILWETGDIASIPEHLQEYFDYEAYGEMLDNNGYFYYLGNGVYLEVWN